MGNRSVEESKMSSTFRELRTTSLALQSFAPQLQGKEVLHRTDNKNTEIIHKADLHNEAVDIYKLCRSFDIRLTVEWILTRRLTSYHRLKIVTITCICLILRSLLT